MALLCVLLLLSMTKSTKTKIENNSKLSLFNNCQNSPQRVKKMYSDLRLNYKDDGKNMSPNVVKSHLVVCIFA